MSRGQRGIRWLSKTCVAGVSLYVLKIADDTDCQCGEQHPVRQSNSSRARTRCRAITGFPRGGPRRGLSRPRLIERVARAAFIQVLVELDDFLLAQVGKLGIGQA